AGCGYPGRIRLLDRPWRLRRDRDPDAGLDVDPQPGQLGGEPRVLPLLADRERELALRGDHRRRPVALLDVDAHHLGRAQGVGDEHRRVAVPRHDVDLLTVELVDDVVDAAAAYADAGADRVDPLLARVDGNFRARAGLAGDRLDLDDAVVDLGHL